jgi:hypothetical protein
MYMYIHAHIYIHIYKYSHTYIYIYTYLIGEDLLFKEAEKYGIDIRTSQNDTKNDDKSSVNNKMTFGFFDNFDNNDKKDNIQNIKNNDNKIDTLEDDTSSVSSHFHGNKSVLTDTQISGVNENEKNKSKISKIPLFNEEVTGIYTYI